MPHVTISLLAGRSVDQKRALVKKVTEAVVETTGAKPESVAIQIDETTKENLAHGGVLFVDN